MNSLKQILKDEINMYFPLIGSSFHGFKPEYIQQKHCVGADYDFKSDMKSLEFNKYLFGDSYIWTVDVSVNPISPNYKFDDMGDWSEYKVVLPDTVVNEIMNGNAILAVDYSLEGYTDIDWDLIIKTLHPIPKEKMIYITSIYNTEILDTDIPCYYNNRWETNLLSAYQVGSDGRAGDQDADWRMYEKQLKLINRLHCRTNSFVTYNRRPREHRLALLGSLSKHNLLDKAIYSWGGDFEAEYDHDGLSMHVYRTYFDGKKRDDEFNKLVEISRRPVVHDVDFNTNPAWLLNWNHVFCTNFQLVTETFANADSTFLSEKSFKPFACGQPFVMWGDVNTVQALREHGYDVYDAWINHSYDTISDPAERLKVITDEVKRLNAISPEKWAEMLYDMLPTIMSNNKNFNKAFDRSLQNKFFKKIT